MGHLDSRRANESAAGTVQVTTECDNGHHRLVKETVDDRERMRDDRAMEIWGECSRELDRRGTGVDRNHVIGADALGRSCADGPFGRVPCAFPTVVLGCVTGAVRLGSPETEAAVHRNGFTILL